MLRAVRTAPLYVLLVLALLFAAIAMIRGPIPPQATNLTTVVFLGDSITQGQHTDDFTQDYTWQTVLGLRAKSARNAQQYLFDGVGGATVGAFLGHLQALNLHPSSAQLIVVELGTNDYLNNVPPATVEQNYAALLLYLAANNPVARLVALTVWGDPVAESAYNSAIAQAAASWTGVGGRAIVDLGPLFLNPLNHWPTGDTFHPNDAGHTAIAQAVLAAVPNTGPSTPRAKHDSTLVSCTRTPNSACSAQPPLVPVTAVTPVSVPTKTYPCQSVGVANRDAAPTSSTARTAPVAISRA